MGYRVGFYCFATSEAATDYKMSQVVPHIDNNGVLVFAHKHNDKWVFKGRTIELSHGHCDPNQEFKDGLEIGLMFLGSFVLVYIIKTAIIAINEFFAADERTEE